MRVELPQVAHRSCRIGDRLQKPRVHADEASAQLRVSSGTFRSADHEWQRHRRVEAVLKQHS